MLAVIDSTAANGAAAIVLAQILGQRGAAAISDVRRQHDELVATPAEKRVGIAHALADPGDEFRQDGVTREVAMGVVDLLEVIDVQQDQRDGLPGTQRPIDLDVDHACELRPVPGAGERVRCDQAFELGDSRLQPLVVLPSAYAMPESRARSR